MPEATTCPTCGRKKNPALTGSFTQWLAGCRCDRSVNKPIEKPVCLSCGKHLAKETTGSFTQWVFSPLVCKCKTPVFPPSFTTIDSSASATKTSTDLIAQLNPQTFPLDRYQPLATLGSGGIGSVFLCLDRNLNKKVAVKVLKTATDDQLIAFQREAKLTAKLNHPNIVNIIDFGVTIGMAPYMVLEYVEGISLEELISKVGKLSETTVRSLSVQIADALLHAHERGIFHRDIKASNIILSSASQGNSRAHIIDFGIAFRDTNFSTGANQFQQGKTVVGTPKYMSPDQFLGRQFDARSEIYSFGCLMFEMITGTAPFQADDPIDLLNLHASCPLRKFAEIDPDINASNDLENIVRRCLEKDPADRFQNMPELKQRLMRHGNTTVVVPLPRSNRKMSATMIIAVVAVMLMSATIYGVSQFIGSPDQAVLCYEILTKIKKGSAYYDFSNRPLNNHILSLLKDNPVVQNINLTGTGITTDGLQFLNGKRLKVVNLDSTAIDSLDKLACRKTLTQLSIKNTKVSDKGIRSLGSFPRLQSLNIVGTQISAKALLRIKRIPLEKLTMDKTSEHEFALLHKRMPNCTINDHDSFIDEKINEWNKLCDEHRTDEAIKRANMLRDLAQSQQNVSLEMFSLSSAAMYLGSLGKPQSDSLWQEALTLGQLNNDLLELQHTYRMYFSSCIQRTKIDEAVNVSWRKVSIAKALLNSSYDIAENMWNDAKTFCLYDRAKEAQKLLSEALVILDEGSKRDLEAEPGITPDMVLELDIDSRMMLAELQVDAQHDLAAARNNMNAAMAKVSDLLRVSTEEKERLRIANLYLGLARLEIAEHNYSEAKAAIRKFEELSKNHSGKNTELAEKEAYIKKKLYEASGTKLD